MLHLISQSPISTAVLERVGEGDCLVFFENAVYRILRNGCFAEVLVKKMNSTCHLFVLQDDLTLRGINAASLISGIEVIGYQELVELTEKHSLIQTWS